MEKKECPCKRVKCERHGDCAACRAHHAEIKRSPNACERLLAQEQRRGLRGERQHDA